MPLPKPTLISFEIQPNSTTEGRGSYNVGTKEKTKLHKTILDVVASRTRLDDLESLLVRILHCDLKLR